MKLLAFFLFLCSVSFSQGCNCDHTITGLSSTSVNIINASSYTYSPGDVFCIDADTIAGLRFIGFEGTASNPVTFINCNGQVIIQENIYFGIYFRESKYVHLTGTGSSSHTYGFHIIETGSGQGGVGVGYLSTDFEIDNIEIENTGFAGIMAKTDPTCSDSLTWRRNGYILNNLEIHHNYIHDIEGEGLYLGYTGGYKITSNRSCSGDFIFGHWLENVEVHHNILENTGWDGIQLNLVRKNGSVHHNTMTNWGTKRVTYQEFAMSIGGGKYEIYNNYMLNDSVNFGKGMQMIGAQSGSKVFNNVIINPYSYGIFIHQRYEYEDSTEGYYILNNTIVKPERAGIFYNSYVTKSNDTTLAGTEQNGTPVYFINNLIVSPLVRNENLGNWKTAQESYVDFNTLSMKNAQIPRIYSNIMSRRLDTLGFTDTLNHDYSPINNSSSFVDVGSDLTAFGVTFDKNNSARPFNGAFDVGAYEYTSSVSLMEHLQNNNTYLYPNPFAGKIHFSGLDNKGVLSIYDIGGRKIQETICFPNQTLDLSGLKRGMYVFVFIDEEGKLIFREIGVKQ